MFILWGFGDCGWPFEPSVLDETPDWLDGR
jgi:hypothetical protein